MGRLDWAQVSFAACVLVNMVDVMGVYFTAPVIVPYGQQIGASTSEIAGFSTVRFGLALVSLLWMPRLADTRGVKLCLLISVLGTAVAYGIQGNAYLLGGCDRQLHSLGPGDEMALWPGHMCTVVNGTISISEEAAVATAVGFGGLLECAVACNNKNGVYAMMAGQALAGFFGGTQPVLRAFVTQISLPDMVLVKLRNTILFASLQAGNFALAPIAGVISRFGLHWPWYVSTAVAVLCFLFVAAFFKNLQKTPSDVEEGNGQDDDATASRSITTYYGPPPIKDKILWIMLLAYWCIFQCVSALILLLPLLLEYEEFGFTDLSSPETSRENVAAATSMVMVPHGLANLVMSTVGFMIVSSKAAETCCKNKVQGCLVSILL